MPRRRRAHDGSQRRASWDVDRMGSYVSTKTSRAPEYILSAFREAKLNRPPTRNLTKKAGHRTNRPTSPWPNPISFRYTVPRRGQATMKPADDQFI